MIKFRKNKRGFTLVETLLYLSISALMFGVVSFFYVTFLEAKEKGKNIAEVEYQGLQAQEAISQAVRNAQSINTPVPGGSGASLSLAMSDAQKNPTIFELSGNKLMVREGASAPEEITTNQVSFESLNFRNLSRPGTHGTVRIEFNMRSVNNNSRYEFIYAKNFYGSASIR